MNKINGFLYGLLSSASFGLIPLFAIPIMRQGMQFESILLYRFLFACLALATILLLTKQSFRIRIKEIPSLLLLAFLYDASAVFLFWGYKFMPSGVATTIHFMYPVLTTIIMMVFFHEKKSTWRLIAVGIAVLGVFFLSYGDTSGSITPTGLIIVLLSALGYALYLITVSQLKVGEMKGLKLTFYVFLFGGILLFCLTAIFSEVQPINNGETTRNLLLLALIPTVISNLALVRAIKSIGSTLTSVLGAMEPVTAVCVGILIFGEVFTQSIAIGIILIITAVVILILRSSKV
jgi:RarD protein